MKKTDILTRKEVKILVDAFYDKVNADTLLGPVFSHVNWPAHLPTMYDFWSSILFGDQSYRGNPFERHLHLNIERTHFSRWLMLFHETVDEQFAGEKAEEAKARASAIANIFQHKLGLFAT